MDGDTPGLEAADPPEAGDFAFKSEELIDASLQGAAQDWVPLDIHQISSGSYRGTCTSLSFEGMHAVHETQNLTVNKVGFTPENVCTVSVVRTTDPALRFSHYREIMNSWLFLLPENQPFDAKVPGGIETVYVCLPQEKLLEGARILNERRWEKPPSELQAFNTLASQTFFSDLLSLLQLYRKTGSGNLAATAPIQSMVMDTILMAMNRSTGVVTGDAPGLRTRYRSHRLVRDAREFIDAALQEGRVPSVVDICAWCGVSVRTLRYSFHRELQLSPLAYLRILRLNRVRSALLTAGAPEDTVTQAATAWGFFHLGRFARDYRRLFGESPSETCLKTSLRQ